MTHEVVEELTTQTDKWSLMGRICFETIQVTSDFSPRPEVRISAGDTCFVLHIAGSEYANPRKPLRSALHKELRNMAKKVVRKRNDQLQTHIIMLTNVRLGRIMGLIGFDTFEVDMPEEYKERVMKGHRTSTSVVRGYELEDQRFLMCYLSGEKFLARFEKKAKGIY